MVDLVIKIFPLCAILCSTVVFFFPWPLNQLSFLLVPLLGFIMLCMGATLSVADFLKTIRKPRAVLIGVGLQFLVMPLLACLIGSLLMLPREQYIGLVMVGTVAGGTASNVIAYLARGDVALSITMTACSTVAGIFLTPLASSFYLGATVDVPAFEMFKSILYMVALPVSLGLLINRLCRNHKALLHRVCPVISVVGIVFVISIIVSLNVDPLRTSGGLVFVAIILHNALGMASGFGLARCLKCDRQSAITIAIEVGMQNSGLAAALSTKCFGVAAALPGALFSIWHNISGALFASFVSKKTE